MLTSCAAPSPTPVDYTVRHVQKRDRSATLDAAEAALIELVTIAGYYALVSMTVNAFEVPLPDGATPLAS